MRRGIVLSLASNVVFFFAGYALHFFLGRTLDPTAYGIIGSIITVLDFEYMFLSNGARQSIAREVSMHRYSPRDLLSKSILFQLLLIIFFFCLNFFGSPIFAILLNDQSFEFYFKIAAFLIPANGIFVIILGLSDGLQKFGTSALLGTIYPLAKLGSIPFIAFIFSDAVVGLEIGFLAALVITILIGIGMLLPMRGQLLSAKGEKIRFSFVAKHTLSFSFFFIMVSIVLSIDTLVVKALVLPASMAGYYTGAVNFGKITYYLLSAIATVILPVVARMVGEGDKKGAIQTTRRTLRLVFTYILPIAVIVSGSAGNLLMSFYTPAYRAAGGALSCLAVSNFFMGIVVVLNMVLNSYGYNRFSNVLSFGSLVVAVPLFVATAKWGGIQSVAEASLLCTFTAAVVTVVEFTRRIGRLIDRKVFVIILLNVIMWGAIKVFDSLHQGIVPVLVLAAGYMMIYAVFLGILAIFHLLEVPSLKDILPGSKKG